MGDGIQISKSLLYQLVENDENSKKNTKKTKPRIPREPQPSQKQPQQKTISNEPEMKGTPAGAWPLQAPLFLPVPNQSTSRNPELESIRSVLKESESVLEKVQKHEENMVKEVTERAKELHEKEFKLPQQKTDICQIEKDACVACYKEHVKDPLKCSTFVGNYQECVRRARKQA
ncbi:hypothetical protein RND81_12G227100 [Saponaria officinalis]|uniref:Uncharacterized protein n=1 Tax=Saponaria officinalis TaxID=3572 RepID=A0AAW1HE39_SAPOF